MLKQQSLARKKARFGVLFSMKSPLAGLMKE